MVLDECTPAGSTDAYLQDSPGPHLALGRGGQSGISTPASRLPTIRVGSCSALVQGGTDPKLRVAHAKVVDGDRVDGYAVGGLSVGSQFDAACRTVAAVGDVLPADKPRYFMGGAQPHEIVAYIEARHRHARLRAPRPGMRAMACCTASVTTTWMPGFLRDRPT